MVMKVVKEDISKILARGDITESTQWLSVKKQKEVVLYWNKALFDSRWEGVYVGRGTGT